MLKHKIFYVACIYMHIKLVNTQKKRKEKSFFSAVKRNVCASFIHFWMRSGESPKRKKESNVCKLDICSRPTFIDTYIATERERDRCIAVNATFACKPGIHVLCEEEEGKNQARHSLTFYLVIVKAVSYGVGKCVCVEYSKEMIIIKKQAFSCGQGVSKVCVAEGGRAFLVRRDGWHPSPRFIGPTVGLRVWPETPAADAAATLHVLFSSNFSFPFPFPHTPNIYVICTTVLNVNFLPG